MILSINTIARPLTPRTAAALGAFVVAAGAAYCILAGLLFCGHLSIASAVMSAAINLLPWLVAFECNKFVLHRVRTNSGRVLSILSVLLLAGLVAGVLDWTIFPSHGHALGKSVTWSLFSSVPQTIVVALLTVIAALLAWPPMKEAGVVKSRRFPIDTRLIAWLKSNGNYVEIRGAGRSHVCRMTLRQAEELLDPKRFVRISRSVIVSKEMVCPHSSTFRDHIRLTDGSEHKIGEAYRAELAKLD